MLLQPLQSLLHACPPDLKHVWQTSLRQILWPNKSYSNCSCKNIGCMWHNWSIDHGCDLSLIELVRGHIAPQTTVHLMLIPVISTLFDKALWCRQQERTLQLGSIWEVSDMPVGGAFVQSTFHWQAQNLEFYLTWVPSNKHPHQRIICQARQVK